MQEEFVTSKDGIVATRHAERQQCHRCITDMRELLMAFLSLFVGTGAAAFGPADRVVASGPAAEHHGAQGADCPQHPATVRQLTLINILARLCPVIFTLHLVEP